jgi:hypothetical protein
MNIKVIAEYDGRYQLCGGGRLNRSASLSGWNEIDDKAVIPAKAEILRSAMQRLWRD